MYSITFDNIQNRGLFKKAWDQEASSHVHGESLCFVWMDIMNVS